MSEDDTCHPPPREEAECPPDSLAHASPDTVESGAWLPLRAALAHLGIAERTLYRRIDRGELRTQKNGPRLEIWCAGAEPVMVADALPATRPQDERSVALAVVEQYGALMQRIEALAAENGQLRAELEAARKHAFERSERLAAEAPASLPAPVPSFRRRWWHRLLFSGE
jgi:hypothetical protein